ncbi:MAG: D-alanyl-D-alanine carboxypeptidase [Defluviicoccus sp.]|nr:D-alanyl-D-alanine carboxypeptidase [Defluviicoccus sp.]MDE0383743.1 D-alanyl-D-alanine carboxypeptidase [Defluviicoccus sp.]
MSSTMGAIRSAQALVAALAAMCVAAATASGMETSAKQAYIVEHETGAVLLDKDGATPSPPASLSKLMTLYMLFERLKSGALSLDDTFVVSRKAWRMGGSKTFVEAGKRVRVEDLLRGIVVQSGNDASIVVAEGLSGTEAAFAEAMNRKARDIGLADSHFVNATGWPADGHAMSPRDIAALSRRIVEEFPEHYPYFAEKSFRFSGIGQRNRNPLLYGDSGADGLKTGYTRASGHSLAASAIREGRRIVMVLAGLPGARQRAREARRLLDWAYQSFRNYTLFAGGAVVEHADVWLGEEAAVALVTEADITITLPRASRRGLEVKVVYEGPVPAPIEKGVQIARLVISAPGFTTREVPLFAGTDIGRLGMFGRLGAAIGYMMWGAERTAPADGASR